MHADSIGRAIWRAALCLMCLTTAAAAAEDPRKREPTGWDVRLAPANEPGEPFELSGTVLDAKGAAIPGAKIFFYHANSAGSYTAPGSQSLQIAATVRTDEKGRYRVRSVFPGSYGGFAAHIHYEVLSPSRWFGEIQLRKKGGQGSANSIEVPRDKDGVWRLSMALTPNGTRHGNTAPGADPRSRAAADSARWD